METIRELHERASKAAAEAANKYFRDSLGGKDQYACGFAWVTVYDVKLSTKVGKEFKAVGFDKAHGGGIQIWNPSKHNCQNIDTKEKGAQAYAEVFKAAGYKAYAGSRMD